MESDNKDVLDGVITAYRAIIEDRYQYENIKEKYTLPASFDAERINRFRRYFLEYVYPDLEQRDALNEAFESLDNYIKNPDKLLRILIDSSRLIFKFGRHLPKILKAGIQALRSFRKANEFERKLVKSALDKAQTPPFKKEDIHTFIRGLSRNEIDQFIESSESLFSVLHDRKLVKKIQEIVEYLIQKMKQRPNVYSEAEIKGLSIGYEMIKNGDQLFNEMSTEDQQQIFEFIVMVERDTLDQIFNSTT